MWEVCLPGSTAQLTQGLGDAYAVESTLLETKVAQRGRAAYAAFGGALVLWAALTLLTGLGGLTEWQMYN